MNPRFNVGDRVKLVNDDMAYTIEEVYAEFPTIKYKIQSSNGEYNTIALENQLEYFEN